MTDGPLRIVALADTDSYVKWAAALLGALPAGSDAELLVVETPLAVSPAQLESALARSGIDPARVRRMRFEDLANALADLAPDAVIVAARGPVVRVLIGAVAALNPRPVIVSGLPGISIPATTAAVIHRTQSDLFVLHSTREVEAFTALARRRGLSQQFALARLPFAASRPPIPSGAEGRTDLVFASQAIVPREHVDRMRVARLLVRAADADPGKRVVVKERATAGEHQTHEQRHSYPDLLRRLAPLPSNLVVSTESMSRALDTAEGLVTVSSTAAIEAVARGIPGHRSGLVRCRRHAHQSGVRRQWAFRLGGCGHPPGVPDAATRVAGAKLLPRSREGRLGRAGRRARRPAASRRAPAQARPRSPRREGPGCVGAQARPGQQGPLTRRVQPRM